MMRPLLHVSTAVAAVIVASGGCGDDRLYDERGMSAGYRSGTEDDGFLSNGERGTIEITEVLWAGSVEQVADGFVRHPDDVFIELRNKHSRPIHLTGWQIIVEGTSGAVDETPVHFGSFVLPPRENGRPVEVNEYVVVAARRNGAFADADYFVEDLSLPTDHFEITLRDLDHRLIDTAGEGNEDVPAGAWDLVTARSMERVQLIFSNDGGRNASWHTYSLNDWDTPLHTELRSRVAPAFRARTFATPCGPNTPDYSGNTSAGDLE